MAMHTNELSESHGHESITPPLPETNGSYPLEKDFSPNGKSNHTHLDATHDREDALHRMRTAGSISISPELFEKLYLSPDSKPKGHLRMTFANPTPLALVGFLLALTPLSISLMEWRGSGGSGAATIGAYFFFGGLLMLLGGLGEWIIGNTFPFVVFASFGAFYLTWGATLDPSFNAYGAYSTTSKPADGLNTIGFRSSLGFFFLCMALLCLVFLICSLRTNLVFVLIFVTLLFTFCFLAAMEWQMNNGNAALSHRLQIAGGSFAFLACICGWWIFLAIMLAELKFPWSIPVGDLSRLIKPKSAEHIA